MHETPPTFGTRFLDELRRQGQPVGENYAVIQRIKGMERADLLKHVGKLGGLTYAERQHLKTLEAPEEFAREVARIHVARNQQTAVVLILLAGL